MTLAPSNDRSPRKPDGRDAPPLDAEKASSQQVVDNYRRPPGVGGFDRSTLVVGGRGAGKTMLLRHHRHTFEGIGLYGDLMKITGPILREIGPDAFAENIDAGLAAMIEAKTTALISLWAAEGIVIRGSRIPWSYLQATLPPNLRSARASDEELTLELQGLYDRVCDASLDMFTGRTSLGALDAFLMDAQELAATPFMILLDRAELVPRPCLRPVLHLLDQASPCRTLVATRPGALMSHGPGQGAILGDHFSTKHLGREPYASPWHEFMRQALAQWLPRLIERIPVEHLDWIFTMSRDSLRVALEVVANSFDESGNPSIACTRRQLQLIQSDLLQAVDGELADIHPDVRGFLRQMRANTAAINQPTALALHGGRQTRMFQRTRVDLFIDVGLRLGMFAVPHGEVWHPDLSPSLLEIPPIYLWREKDPPWSITA